MKIKRNRFMILTLCAIFTMAAIFSFAACSRQSKVKIVFADADWDSIRFHNSVAKVIIENGYGYETDVVMGTTPVTFTALRNGDINAYMEVWSDNIATYDEAIESGDILELSVNFSDNAQGLYVPTYVIEGDQERGIEPLAPDLKYVKDLSKYKDIFKDPEDPNKGRIYGSISGWAADEFLFKKYEAYNLNETYNYLRPGSDTALSASIAAAFERGEPWVGYYWEPTWVMGKYDMTLLADDEYTPQKWDEGTCVFPSVRVTVCVNKSMQKVAPEVVEFLKNYKTSSQLTSDALAYMMQNGATHDETAVWFLKTNEDLWKGWVPEDVASKVMDAIK